MPTPNDLLDCQDFPLVLQMPEIIKEEKSEMLKSYYKLHLEKMHPGVIKSLGYANETILFEKKNHKENLYHESKYPKKREKNPIFLFNFLFHLG